MSQIYLRFNSIHLEDHLGSRCRTAYDKIDVYDGNTSASPLLKTLCGSMPPTSFQSTSNSLYVEFIADSRVQLEGFHASYKFIFHTTTYTSTVTATTTSTSITNGAITTKSALTKGTNEFENEVTSISYMIDQNNSYSVNLALHDRQNHEELDAGFIEQTDVLTNGVRESKDDNVFSDPGITGST